MYILGDQHLKRATTAANECDMSPTQGTTILGVDAWLERLIQHAPPGSVEILLEIDPILSQTMQLQNSWIALLAQRHPRAIEPHLVDLRGSLYVPKFGDNAAGHLQINAFLSALYDAADAVRTRRPVSATLRRRLQSLDADHDWTDQYILTTALELADAVDTHVQHLLNQFLTRGRTLGTTIVLFVGEAHALMYREWMRRTWPTYPLQLTSPAATAAPTSTLSKCLDISDLATQRP
jgi:hypothetical protein